MTLFCQLGLGFPGEFRKVHEIGSGFERVTNSTSFRISSSEVGEALLVGGFGGISSGPVSEGWLSVERSVKDTLTSDVAGGGELGQYPGLRALGS